jgi:hypothetical protein
MSAFGSARPKSARLVALGSTSRFSSRLAIPLTSAEISFWSTSVASGSIIFHEPSLLRSNEVSPLAVTRISSIASASTANTLALASVSVRSDSTK